MTGWLIYDQKQYERNAWFANELIRYCSAFCEMKLILVERLNFGILDGRPACEYEGRAVRLPAFAVSRTIFPMLSFFLENAGVRVFNDHRTSLLCNDKRYTYTVIASANVPIMNTFFYQRDFFGGADRPESASPLVLKSACGHGGKEVFLVDGPRDMNARLEEIPGRDFLLQDVCKTTGRDLRVYVLGGVLFAAVLRSSGQFRSNYSLGGSAEAFQLSDGQAHVVSRVLDALPCRPDFIGIDFLVDGDTLIFNEIEDVVGARMLYQTTDLDAALEYSRYINSALERRGAGAAAHNAP